VAKLPRSFSPFATLTGHQKCAIGSCQASQVRCYCNLLNLRPAQDPQSAGQGMLKDAAVDQVALEREKHYICTPTGDGLQRDQAAAAVVGTRVYALGGRDISGAPTNTLIALDLADASPCWRPVGSASGKPPPARHANVQLPPHAWCLDLGPQCLAPTLAHPCPSMHHGAARDSIRMHVESCLHV
jgi:hypothetical protein